MTRTTLPAAAQGSRMPSMRHQILRWLLPLHLLVAIASGMATWAVYGALIESFMKRQMQVLAESYARDSGRPVVLVPQMDSDMHQGGQFAIQVWSADGRVVASNMPSLRMPMLERPGVQSTRSADGHPWRAYVVPPGPGTWGVQVMQSEHFLQGEIVTRALFAAVPIALLVPLVLMVLWRVVANSTSTLRAVAEDVAARDERRLDPISLDRVPQEIVPLVDSFNALLARLTHAFEGQRRFVQDAAHELRTPIAAMALQIENLRASLGERAAGDELAHLRAGVARAGHLVDQLLRLSRQEAQARQAVAEPVDLTSLVRESVGQLMVLADHRRVEVSFSGEPCPAITGSPSDLRSVLDSLLDNALRYTPEGGNVEVRLRADGDDARIDILDDGPGIEPALRERVFDRFFRVPGTQVSGSGLGLAIARAAAERQGLGIELLSRDDGRRGLLARIRIPAGGAASGAHVGLRQTS